jgi:2-(1,2-epoxy-1,2-dihydrophenyl)acetyl-CoA isomerase
MQEARMQIPAATTLALTLDAGVLTITLNRPEVLNAVNEQMTTDLSEALRFAERADEVRAVVVTGAGRSFCSGQDLREPVDAAGASYGATLRRRYNPIVATMRTLEKPILAAVNGVAAGAGCNLALAADLRIASDRASFIELFSRIGLIPDSGGTFTLPRLVGLARAMEMACLAEPVNAEDALRAGLVNRVVAHDDLQTAAGAWARRLAEGPTRAYGLTKRAFNYALTAPLDAVLEYEAHLQEVAGRTADHREGVAAFREKRPARFAGC